MHDIRIDLPDEFFQHPDSLPVKRPVRHSVDFIDFRGKLPQRLRQHAARRKNDRHIELLPITVFGVIQQYPARAADIRIADYIENLYHLPSPSVFFEFSLRETASLRSLPVSRCTTTDSGRLLRRINSALRPMKTQNRNMTR